LSCSLSSLPTAELVGPTASKANNMAGESGAKSCLRVSCVIFIILATFGGAAVAAFFAIRNKGSPNDSRNSKSNAAGVAQSPKTAQASSSNIADFNSPPDQKNIFYGLNYSPFGLGDNRVCPPWDSNGGQCLLQDQVQADMRQLAGLTKRIKIYSSTCLNASKTILNYAVKYQLEVALGVWISKNSGENEREYARFQEVLAQYAHTGVIKSIVVGNEPIFVLGMSVQQVAAAITRVRAMVKSSGSSALIGTAEIFNMWMKQKNPVASSSEGKAGPDMEPIVKVLDFIGLNSHPYYGGVDPVIGNGADFVHQEKYTINQYWSARGHDLPVWITETGYPTEGKTYETAAPSMEGLEAYAAQIESTSREFALPVYFFEPFNGDWKRRWDPFSEADYNFGLMTCNRDLKPIKLPPSGAV
jgi:glucan 1,3-beta-glucosidase